MDFNLSLNSVIILEFLSVVEGLRIGVSELLDYK